MRRSAAPPSHPSRVRPLLLEPLEDRLLLSGATYQPVSPDRLGTPMGPEQTPATMSSTAQPLYGPTGPTEQGSEYGSQPVSSPAMTTTPDDDDDESYSTYPRSGTTGHNDPGSGGVSSPYL